MQEVSQQPEDSRTTDQAGPASTHENEAEKAGTAPGPDDTQAGRTVDHEEVARFSRIAAEWWDPDGKFKPLHKFNPTRLDFLKRTLCTHFKRDPQDPQALKGLRILDIGCGGGLLAEPVARMGANVVGADPSRTNIETARIHASETGTTIDYRQTTAEDLAAENEQFDVVLNMEVVEHVADVPLFVTTCASMVKPDGLMLMATLNRTMKSYFLAIVGAEYVLRWLPVGTHQWDKFVTPAELETSLSEAGLTITDRKGVSFNPLTDIWSLSSDMDVNYMLVAHRPIKLA